VPANVWIERVVVDRGAGALGPLAGSAPLEGEGDLAGVVAVDVGDADDGGGHVGGADGAHDETVDGEHDRPGELEGDVVGLGQDLWPPSRNSGSYFLRSGMRLLIGDASTERGDAPSVSNIGGRMRTRSGAGKRC
jgi:hypothetical protein